MSPANKQEGRSTLIRGDFFADIVAPQNKKQYFCTSFQQRHQIPTK